MSGVIERVRRFFIIKTFFGFELRKCAFIIAVFDFMESTSILTKSIKTTFSNVQSRSFSDLFLLLVHKKKV